MYTVLFGIWLAAYLTGAVLYVLYLMHMFQQDSYKPREYREWMQVHTNVGRLLGKCLYAVFSLPLVIVGNLGCLVAACAMNIMTILVNKPHKAKKPLVYTPRVRRMLVTTAALYGIVIAAAVFLGLWGPVWGNSGHMWKPAMRYMSVALLLLFILQPFIILAANLINHPIE